VTLFATERHVVADDHDLPAISITVYGAPAPQGSKRHVGNGRMIEMSKKVKPWRQDVKAAATLAVDTLPAWSPLDGPLAASMTFTFLRPKGHFGTGRNAGIVKGSALSRPAVTPDLSKLVRSTEDALTGLVWADDARVVEYRRCAKHYASDGAADVLDVAGCVIRIWQLPPAVAR
jgi:Holliday junction resolvase RusA-like endonuclease